MGNSSSNNNRTELRMEVVSSNSYYKERLCAPTIGADYEGYASIPRELREDKIRPFPTQLKTLHKMQHIERNCKISLQNDSREVMNQILEFESHVGVLANKPGAGKSLVVLALCCEPCPTKNSLTLTKSNAFSSTTYRFREWAAIVEDVPCNLIVVPPKLLLQWTDYVKDYFRDLPFAMINHNKLIPSTIQEFKQLVTDNKILFVTSSLLGDLSALVGEVRFDRIFFDEIDTLEFIRASNMDIHAQFMWFVTATPGKFFQNQGRALGVSEGSALPKNFKEYLRTRTDFRTLRSDILPHFVARCEDADIDADLNLPPYELTVIKVPSSAAVRLTAGLLNHEANQLIHGDRIHQAIHLLTGQTDEDDDPEAMPKYTLAEAVGMHLDNNIHEVQEKIQFLNDQLPTSPAMAEQKRLQLEKYTIRVEQLMEQKDNLMERVRSSTECMICLDEEMTNPVGVKCCNQGFCRGCIKNWIKEKPSCPNCRAKIKGIEDFLLPPRKRKIEDADTNDGDKPRTKLAALKKILKDSHKSIVYLTSASDTTANFLSMDLNNQGIKVVSFTGLTSVGCQRVMLDFKNCQEKTCLIVSCMRNSAGFNLPFVDTIVMYQNMPNDEMQIIGRGMRPGRTSPLKVFRIEYELTK